MNRNQYLIGLGIVFLIFSAGIILFLNKKIDRNNGAETPLNFIPQKTSLIIKINEANILDELLNGKYEIADRIFMLKGQEQMKNTLHRIQDEAKKDRNVYQQLARGDHYFTVKARQSGDNMWMLCLGNSNDLTISTVKKLTTQIWDSTASFKETSRRYEGFSIFHFSKPQSDIYITDIGAFYLVSNSTIYIEDAIRQLKNANGNTTSNGFTELLSSAGKSKPINIFLNLNEAASLIRPFVNDVINLDASKNLFKKSWCELDLNLKQEQILLNGFFSQSDSAHNILSLPKYSEPVKISADKILPANIGSFFVFGSSDMKQFYQNYLEYLKNNGNTTLQDNNISLNKKLKFSLSNEFMHIVDNEIGRAYHSFGAGEEANYVFMKTIGSGRAKELIQKLFDAYDTKMKDNTFNYQLDNQVSYDIYFLPEPNFCRKVFGPAFGGIVKTYVVIYDNYLIFSDSYKNLTYLIHQGILKKTLDTDPHYIEFKNNLSSKSYFTLYNNMARHNLISNKALSIECIKSWETNLPVFQHLPAVGVQISEVSDIPYCNFIWNHSKSEYNKPQTIWESQLDTTLDFKPQFVVNHYTREKEIFVQDELNQIYLLNKAGRILWKQPVNEKINSEVFQVDYYKNGKLQYLFSTKNSLHLIDRNGNYVERYPVKLRSPSTAGMALFDYDNTRNYRILIPTANKKMYMYTIDGKQVSGWGFKGSEHKVYNTPQHFRIYNKDYISFGDKYRHYFLNRQGSIRLNPEKQFPKAKKSTYFLQDGGDLKGSCFITSDTSGAVLKMYLSGKTEREELSTRLSEKHVLVFQDITADGKVDYIYLDKGELITYDHNGSRLFKFEAEKDFINTPVTYHFSYSDRKIGLISAEPSTIYLINKDGSLYKGFPLIGNTLFSIGHFDFTSNNFNLIVGGRNNFLYNYVVE